MDIAELCGEWPYLVQKYRTGQMIDKKEVLDVLASDEPVPDYAKEILAVMLSGEYKFKRGTKPRRFSMLFRCAIADMIDLEVKERSVPVQVVKDEYSYKFGVSNRVIEEFITERNNRDREHKRLLKQLIESKQMDNPDSQ